MKKIVWRLNRERLVGGKPVNVFTPKEPTKKEYNETVDFLLGELDDHDAIDEYNELIEKKW